MKKIEGKTVIVTGGASGIGEAICRYLAEKGAKVYIADRNSEAAKQTASEITKAGGLAKAVSVDVSKAEDVEALIEEAFSEDDQIDYLFNNAGISVNGEFQDIDLGFWHKIVEVNLWGVVYGCKYVYPIMLKQGFGHIINVASLGGLIPGGPYTPYSATKHAVVGFSLSLRGEAKQYGINVTALCPGYINTNIQKSTPNFSAYLDTERSRKMSGSFTGPEKVIPQMIRGILKNQAVVISPRIHKVFWWLYRISPSLLPTLTHKMIAYLKKNRKD